jgi:hypothetical protein
MGSFLGGGDSGGGGASPGGASPGMMGQAAQYGRQLAQPTGVPQLYNAASTAFSGGGTGGTFLQGLQEGLTGVLSQYADPSAGTQFGQGLGMLGAFLGNQGGGMHLDAGSLLQSALAHYGIGSQPAVRPAAPIIAPAIGRNETDPQSGFLHLDVGSALKSYLSGGGAS